MKRLLLKSITATSVAAPLALHAAEAVPGATGSIAQMLFGLGVVLALIYGALLLLRRLQHSSGAAMTNLKVLSATSVGPRERVVMVATGKHVLVLGVAPGRVNLLHHMTEADLPAPEEHKSLSGPDFGTRLKQLIERGRRDA